ncbi:nuclear-pore anchor-like isoform X2 [Magnolia sinica]|uniref:nuclear-pore anchor-like isoform X2 n=1 Tax=Magnolia sinica TaxID=86752 RepID=UPI002659CB15|nr:nuclear-pore anchor-like isoform X2 [Magnolia sinica]
MLFSPSTQGRDDRFPEKGSYVCRFSRKTYSFSDCIVEYASIIQKKGDIPSTHTLSLLAKLLKKSVEDEIYFLKPRVSELESDLVSKSTEVTSAVSRKEEALSSTFAEIDRLKEENSVKM